MGVMNFQKIINELNAASAEMHADIRRQMFTAVRRAIVGQHGREKWLELAPMARSITDVCADEATGYIVKAFMDIQELEWSEKQ